MNASQVSMVEYVGQEYSPIQDLEQIAEGICVHALEDAKLKLHPLLRNKELNYLGKRVEFVQAFKHALEFRIAEEVTLRYPEVQAVFQYDESWMESRTSWDGSIHLLVKVPLLSDALALFGNRLDQSLVDYLKRSGWSRFRDIQTMLEIQQVTQDELRRRISYGAMFCAVHSMPVKVWPK